MSEIKLGQIVKDKSSGLTGIVEVVFEKIHSSDSVTIQPYDKGGKKMLEGWTVDTVGVVIVDEKQQITPIEPGVKNVHLGDKVKCSITKFKGTCTRIGTCLNGCYRVLITGEYNSRDNKSGEIWADMPGVEVLKAAKKSNNNKVVKKTGGPKEKAVRFL